MWQGVCSFGLPNNKRLLDTRNKTSCSILRFLSGIFLKGFAFSFAFRAFCEKNFGNARLYLI